MKLKLKLKLNTEGSVYDGVSVGGGAIVGVRVCSRVGVEVRVIVGIVAVGVGF